MGIANSERSDPCSDSRSLPPKEPSTLLTCIRCLDLWDHIAGFVDPPDIISLRKTCSLLYALSQRTSIWIQAAQDLCYTHGLLSTSFPFETMSLSDLEHLALSPFRFEAEIRNNHWQYLSPVQTRTLIPRPGRFSTGVVIDSLYLLPGGRYLFTCTQSEGIYLWDLGYNAACSPKLLPLAHLPIASSFITNQPLPTEDGKGAQLLISCSNLKGTEELRLYECYPALDKPRFSLLKSSKLSERPRLMVQSNQCIILVKDDSTVLDIYAPRSDSSSWIKREWDPQVELQSVAMFNTTVVGFDSNAIYVYELPLCYSSVIRVELPEAPAITLKRPDSSTLSMVYTSDWTGRRMDHLLCLLAPSDDDELPAEERETAMHLFRMESLSLLRNPRIPSYLPIQCGSFQSVIGESDYALPDCASGNRLWRSPTDCFVLGLSTGNEVALMKYALPEVDCADTVFMTMESTDDQCLKLDNFSICCSTGRLVTAHPAYPYDTDEWEIHVHDFLAPSSLYNNG